MELRVLEYFLAIANYGTISLAAQHLHITQPTLSRQMKELEEEIGKVLFIRSNKQITLTQDGILFRQRAKEIMSLVDKTKAEMMTSDSTLSGDISIGSGESHALKVIIKAMKIMQQQYPLVTFHIHSGNAFDILDKMDQGLIDFGLMTHHPKVSSLHHIAMPQTHKWGVLMRFDDPLALKDNLVFDDIKDKPLLLSKEINQLTELVEWLQNDLENLNILSTYSLLYNASLMVEEGLGYALCFDKLINTSGDSLLVFKPLSPLLYVPHYFVWKKERLLSKASQVFLEIVKQTMND